MRIKWWTEIIKHLRFWLQIISKELTSKQVAKKQMVQKSQFFYIIWIMDAGSSPETWPQIYLITSTALSFDSATIYFLLPCLLVFNIFWHEARLKECLSEPITIVLWPLFLYGFWGWSSSVNGIFFLIYFTYTAFALISVPCKLCITDFLAFLKK